MKEERIIVTFFTVPLKIKYDALGDLIDKNPILNGALLQYLGDTLPDHVEIWLIEHNIAVTEVGYIVAMEQTEELKELIEENERRKA